MTEADTSPDTATVNIRMVESFLADVDATWKEQGYNSRSEFVRDVLRDAVKHPEFNRADWKAIAAGEVEVAEGRTRTSDEVKASLKVGDE